MNIRAIHHAGRCAAVVLLMASSTIAARVDVTDPPSGLFVDDWMSVELAGQHAGYSHTTMSRSGDRISTSTLMSLTIGRAGAGVKIAVLQTTTETLAGMPVSFSSVLDASAQRMESRGKIRDGRVEITKEQFGVKLKDEYDFPTGALMSWGMYRHEQAMGFKPGTTYTVKLYEPSMSPNNAIDVEVTIHDQEDLTLDGKTFRAYRSTQKMMGITNTAWLDDAGKVIRTELAMMGLPLSMTRTDKATALKDFDPPELFMPTTIKANRKIDRHNAKQIDFTLRLREAEDATLELPGTGMQRVLGTDSNGVRLTVNRIDTTGLKKLATKSDPDPALAEFLSANAVINSDDPRVVDMARQARGDVTQPYALADRLRRYVSDVIEDKSLDVGFATASEVCRDRRGDCSEHAVLLAALGRASGLPTRVVTGVVYVPIFGGDEDIFGFHMWTQFNLGGTWVDFDAAQNESDCNPTHIAFHVSSLADSGLGEVAFGLIHVIGNLDIHIDRVE